MSSAPKPAPEVKPLSFRQLLEKTFDPEPFIVSEGILPKNGLLFVAGPPKSYKSFLTQSVIYHLVTGTNLFGACRFPHGRSRGAEMAFTVASPQRVLLLEQEIGFQDTRNRLMPCYASLGPQAPLMADNLFIHSRDHHMRLDTPEGVKRIESLIRDCRPDVVCFDPLIEFHRANENDAQSMGNVLGNLDLLRETYHFATIVSHHTGKPDVMNGRSGPDLMRGSSTIYGKGDAYIMLTVLNRNVGQVKLDFTVRRGAPIRSLDVLLDWGEMRAKFHSWAKNPTNRIESVADATSDDVQ